MMISYRDFESNETLNVKDVLSNEDQEMIQDYIQSFGGLYSGIKSSPADLSHVLRYWARNKAHFYHMLGNQLFISRPIKYKASLYKMRETLEKNLNTETRTFFNLLSDYLRSDNPVSKAFHKEGLWSYQFNRTSLYEMLLENRWEYNNVDIPMENGKFFHIKTGMRVTRIFQKLAEIGNIGGFELVRELHAKISTSKTVNGDMYLTIHPMDYITMSDNDDGWDSCMNWVNQGDYRSGTVEMMNSPFIIEAFIPSASNKFIFNGNHKWNSKIWRELYIVTPDLISNIRAYPFIDSGLSDIAVKWIAELAEQAGIGHYRHIIEHIGDDNSKYVDDNNITLRMNTNNMYNDYGRETQHVIFAKDFVNRWGDKEWKDSYLLNYSGPMICMNCGDDMSSSLDETRAVMCDDCSTSSEEAWTCDYCGETFYHEDELYVVDDTSLCENCMNDPDTVCVAYDDQCPHLVNNCTKIYLGDPHYNIYIHVYDHHWWIKHNEDNITKDKIKYINLTPTRIWGETAYMIPAEYITDNMVRELGNWRDADSLREWMEAENHTPQYKELDTPMFAWGA